MENQMNQDTATGNGKISGAAPASAPMLSTELSVLTGLESASTTILDATIATSTETLVFRARKDALAGGEREAVIQRKVTAARLRAADKGIVLSPVGLASVAEKAEESLRRSRVKDSAGRIGLGVILASMARKG